MELGVAIGWIIGAAVIGLVGGFFLARFMFKRSLQKNPPINEKMVRAMLAGSGRTPSEKQVREIMRNINNSNK